MDDKNNDHPRQCSGSSKQLTYSEILDAADVAEILESKKVTKLTTHSVKESSVMKRIYNLLPAMAEAEKKLQQESPEKKDIEIVGNNEYFVEMAVTIFNEGIEDPKCDRNDLEFSECINQTLVREEEFDDDSDSTDSSTSSESDISNSIELLEDCENSANDKLPKRTFKHNSFILEVLPDNLQEKET